MSNTKNGLIVAGVVAGVVAMYYIGKWGFNSLKKNKTIKAEVLVDGKPTTVELDRDVVVPAEQEQEQPAPDSPVVAEAEPVEQPVTEPTVVSEPVDQVVEEQPVVEAKPVVEQVATVVEAQPVAPEAEELVVAEPTSTEAVEQEKVDAKFEARLNKTWFDQQFNKSGRKVKWDPEWVVDNDYQDALFHQMPEGTKKFHSTSSTGTKLIWTRELGGKEIDTEYPVILFWDKSIGKLCVSFFHNVAKEPRCFEFDTFASVKKFLTPIES